jgi:hypothetical protein
MRFVARRWWTALGSAAAALSLTASLASSAAVTACGDDCFCNAPEVDVVVPAASAAEVVSVSASGPACTGVTGSCDQQGTTGCVDYAVVPNVAGDCAVTVTFSDGSLQQETFTFGGTPTCCGDLGGGGELDVVAPAGGIGTSATGPDDGGIG